MRADPPRDNLPAQMRCGDPLSAGGYLRMQDQSQPLVPRIEPSIPADHLEPRATECEGARVNHKLEQNTVLIETAARWMKLAEKWKCIAVRELMRRPDFPAIQGEGISYGLFELDHAKQEAAFWNMDTDSKGNVGLERQS